MRRIAVVLIAVIAVAVVAYVAPAFGRTGGDASPIYGIT
jgi:hypothetical protein